MDENDMKRFGFLPSKNIKRKKLSRRANPQKSSRFYVPDVEGIYLTTREAEVSWLMAKGYTVREAGEMMDLSPRTVEFYLTNVRRKLNVRYKHELLRVLYDNDFFQGWQ